MAIQVDELYRPIGGDGRTREYRVACDTEITVEQVLAALPVGKLGEPTHATPPMILESLRCNPDIRGVYWGATATYSTPDWLQEIPVAADKLEESGFAPALCDWLRSITG